ncbi:MAG: VTC domain-containing protein [Nannocystaceae bacterium]
MTDGSPVASSSSPAISYRYERKAHVSELDLAHIEQLVRLHPAAFREVFSQRFVNNIYFDTVDFRSLAENIEGDEHRTKYRLRWYGELLGKVARPVLELKIKSNAVGRKANFPVQSFRLELGFAARTVRDAILASDLPPVVHLGVSACEAKLMNRYTRRYYLSACSRFRLTIDRNLEYYRIRPTHNTLIHNIRDRDVVVVELKYDREHDEVAHTISSYFPFLQTKSSKYVRGVHSLWRWHELDL